MNAEEYVHEGGYRCLRCHSERLVSKNIEFNNDIIYTSNECQDCRATWDDVYRLVDVINLERGTE